MMSLIKNVTYISIRGMIYGILISCLFLIASPVFCEGQELPPDKTIRFVGRIDWKPFHFLRESGQPNGFSVDLINALCKELNLRCEIKLYADWDEAQKDVSNGRADAVIGFARTAEREKDFDLSYKIASLNIVIAVREETITVHSIEDLYGTSIAVTAGTPYLMHDLIKDTRLTIVPVYSESHGLQKLINKEVSAVIADELTIRYTVQYYKIEGVKIVGKPYSTNDYVIGVKKGNEQLLGKINAGLSILETKEITKNLRAKWFGLGIRVLKTPPWIRWAVIAGVTIMLLIGISSVILLTFNKKLKKEVRARTVEIEKVNEELKKGIDNLKHAEEALVISKNEFQHLSQEFEALLDAIPDNLTLQTPELKVIWANRGAAVGLGKEISDLVGQYCYRLWHNRSTPCDNCPVKRTLSTGNAEYEVMSTPDGRTWDIRTIPVRGEEGKVTNVVEVKRDITEHRRLEDRLRHSQKIEAVGQLAGGVAHDFNNILTAIIGYASILQMKMKKDEPLRTHVDKILASSERAASLTQSLLAFSRKQIINPRPINLNQVVKNVEKLLFRVIGEDVELKVILTDKDLTVMADSVHIEQVLMNLVSNARDAMPDGGELTIRTERMELREDFISTYGYGEPGEYALLSVTDTGVGMDKATLGKIFDPFFTTKEEGRGTGLGLSIVYGIIKQHNGYINCYSELGIGTEFKVFIPLIKPGSDAEEAGTTRKTAAPKRGTETILVAEDEEEVRKLIREVLEGFGYKVIEAVNGEDAIKRFIENRDGIKLLILDVIMPKKNGKEAYEEIKKIKPDTMALFMSGYTANIIHKKGIIEKELNFISKPVLPTDLLIKVREVLDGKIGVRNG